MLLRYRYRIEPTVSQRSPLARTFGCARVVYNDAIRARDAAFRSGEKIGPTEVQRRVITHAKNTVERAWLAAVASVALVQSVRDAHRAHQNFLNALPNRNTAKWVVRATNPARTPVSPFGSTVRPTGRLFLAKIGEVRVRWSRPLPSEPVLDREAGIDLGISRFATVANTDGPKQEIVNPKFLARYQRKLARLEREKARRVKGGRNRAKARSAVASVHRKIARTRRDHHHKQTLMWIRDNQVVHIEDLNIAGLVKNRRLARAIHDAAWAQFVRLLEQKAELYGRSVTKVSRWLPSSKMCSNCGHVVAVMPLKIREWTCSGCDARHDRDYNAARNILAAGRAERLNAGGAHVRPPLGVAAGDEAGSASDAV